MSTAALSQYSLQHMPDVAKEVGFLVMVSSNLDSWMLPALADMLRGKSEVATAIIGRVDSLSAKFEVLVDIAHTRVGTPMGDAILKHEVAVRRAITFRNKLAHGMYGFDENGGHILIPFPFSQRRGTPKPIAVDPSIIRPHTESIGLMIEGIASIAGQSFVGVPQSIPSSNS